LTKAYVETRAGVLADEGFRVLEADNGRTALAVIAAENPRLVLLDIWMPEVDGVEILREIQKRHPGTRVIVISGHGNIETAVRATQLGAIDFIEKPFSIERLLQRIERALGSPAARLLEDEAVATASPLRAPATPVGRTSRARTLARSVVINGHGLHSGIRTETRPADQPEDRTGRPGGRGHSHAGGRTLEHPGYRRPRRRSRDPF
jgi:DNA-binding NtrC family response regulator